MASLKEVKNRIASVNSTRKITSAMKMVASSKLHKAQQAIENMRPYERSLSRIVSSYASSLDESTASPLSIVRETRRVALVVLTSNSSLCGGFNGNVVKALQKKLQDYRQQGIAVVRIYALGKKGMEATLKMQKDGIINGSELVDTPNYAAASEISEELMQLFQKGEIDKAEMIYHHFKSNSHQILTEETFLPIQLESDEGKADNHFYIVEPSPSELILELVPKALHLKLFAAILDSIASEHAARVIAMQVATDNADELLQELTLTYNKTRQQAITTELLDLVGGSMQ